MVDLTLLVCSDCGHIYTKEEIDSNIFLCCNAPGVEIDLRAIAENYPALYMKAVTKDMLINYT